MKIFIVEDEENIVRLLKDELMQWGYTVESVKDFQRVSDEVEEGKYWSQEEIENNLDKSVFTPNFEKEFSMFGNSLSALL